MAAGSTGKLSRKNVVAAVSAGSLVLAIDAGAQANRLDGESLGEDWLMAGVEDQVAWAKRMAEIFNKDEAFANALEGCLAGTLGITEGFAEVGPGNTADRTVEPHGSVHYSDVAPVAAGAAL